MYKKIKGKHIAIIVAHPDDESVLAGGTVIKHTLAGGRSSLFCATLGEKGSAYLSEKIKKSEFKLIRKKELMDAAKFMGVSHVKISSLPDSKIADYKVKLKEEIRKFLVKSNPDIVISFGVDGFTGHVDHIAVSNATLAICRSLGLEFWEFSKPPEDKCKDIEQYLKKKQKNGLYQKKIIKRGTTTFAIKVDPNSKFKLIRLYRTQFQGINPYNIFPKKIAEHMLKNEYFRSTK